MPEVDFFNFFRWLLSIIATVYATVVTLQSLWGWYVWFAGQDPHIGMLRRYVLVQGLRLRVLRFGPDVLICLLLCVAFFMLWHAHHVMFGISDTLATLK